MNSLDTIIKSKCVFCEKDLKYTIRLLYHRGNHIELSLESSEYPLTFKSKHGLVGDIAVINSDNTISIFNNKECKLSIRTVITANCFDNRHAFRRELHCKISDTAIGVIGNISVNDALAEISIDQTLENIILNKYMIETHEFDNKNGYLKVLIKDSKVTTKFRTLYTPVLTIDHYMPISDFIEVNSDKPEKKINRLLLLV